MKGLWWSGFERMRTLSPGHIHERWPGLPRVPWKQLPQARPVEPNPLRSQALRGGCPVDLLSDRCRGLAGDTVSSLPCERMALLMCVSGNQFVEAQIGFERTTMNSHRLLMFSEFKTSSHGPFFVGTWKGFFPSSPNPQFLKS